MNLATSPPPSPNRRGKVKRVSDFMIQSKTILKSLPKAIKTINLPNLGKKYQGKVRDFYINKSKRVLITTDRQSAFDVVLGCIPFKGAVLNQLSAFWFEECRDIIDNHMISVQDPNVMIARNCKGINIEMIVRGYISGVTKTSIWGSYQNGERQIYGVNFPDGLKKNQKLPKPVITPTTHGSSASHSTLRDEPSGSDSKSSGSSSGGGHDERLTKKEIIEKKLVSKKLYEQMEKAALALFERGTIICNKAGLILVDTKYEFGLYKGKLIQIDEIHTPDSSRFWIAKTYKIRFKKGLEPENFDKEFLRLWYVKRGYLGDGPPPPMSKSLIIAVAKRYIAVYERITGKKFKVPEYPIEERIKKNLQPLIY